MRINWHHRKCNAYGALLPNMIRFNATYIGVSKKMYMRLNCDRVTIGMIEDRTGKYVALGIKPAIGDESGGSYVLYRTPEKSASQAIKICAGSFIKKYGLHKYKMFAVFTDKTVRDGDGMVFVFRLMKDGLPATLEKEEGGDHE